MPTSTSIIDALAAPPFATLNPVLDEGGPYPTGDYTLTSFFTSGAFLLPAGFHDVGGTYGVIVNVNGAIPPAAGVTFGWVDSFTAIPFGDIYHRRVCQLVLQHFLLISGSWVTTFMTDINSFPDTNFWPVLVGSGGRLGLHVEPGWSVDLQYLCVL